MPNGYYEHDVRVRITEGVLGKSKDWQWLVDETERSFCGYRELMSADEFMSVFNDVSDVYSAFSKVIASCGQFSFESQASWIKVLYRAALIRTFGMGSCLGAEVCDQFSVALDVLSELAYLLMRANDFKFLIASELVTSGNLYSKYDLAPLVHRREKLQVLLDRLALPGAQSWKDTLNNNIDHIKIPVDQDRLVEFLDRHFVANMFSGRPTDVPESGMTWQERLLFSLPSGMMKDERLIPHIQLQGIEDPPISTWTDLLFDRAISYFEEPRAVCMLETARYLLFETVPSEDSIKMLLDLDGHEIVRRATEGTRLGRNQTVSTAVVRMLRRDGAVPKGAESEYLRAIGPALKNLHDEQDIQFGFDCGYPLASDKRRILKEARMAAAAAIDEASDLQAFSAYVQDRRNAKYVNQAQAEKTWDVFIETTRSVTQGVLLAGVAYDYLLFLLELLKNGEVEQSWVRLALINIRRVWQRDLYAKYIGSMQALAHTETVPREAVESDQKKMLIHPERVGRVCLDTTEEGLSAEFKNVAEKSVSVPCEHDECQREVSVP